MSIKDIANDVVALCRAGQADEISRKYQSEDIVSIEAGAPPGADPAARGKAAVQGKAEWWAANHDVVKSEVTGPFVNGEQFAVHFTMDIVVKATGQQMHMTEVGLYTVKNEKIVEERFFYGG